MRKIGLIFFLPVLISGCSSPASEAEIRAAVHECEGVMHDIENQIQPKTEKKFGRFWIEDAEPVTSRQLKSFLKDCKNDKKEIVEASRDQKTISKQINVVAEIKYENEIKHAKSMVYLDSQSEDNAK
ncbi:TPA: hypothetical protein RHI22_002046 [Acinetobacter baumannii]|uniref:hypothetical protein n=1 Tax=Acinetobacter baumannii TaxID=470 RepID=UPI000B53EEEF|nr:hypothetical protein [Acinetobacter baumannii]MBP4979642.1 hypothetical protein [Acinetobacter baumannii]MBV6560848.1 hypothetical protein [Acinetobacter baumannii]MBV6589491.1 hypothetical protein [Acinetobacter baumannii]MDT1781229.1 hypothetical protein [Acinetobacter baumannii]OWX18058.1 hypothetical protein A7A33_08090 [Acinetobacter baumannii]